MDVQEIRIEKLLPTRDNPRVFRDDEAFKALVASVAAQGILSPLIARPHPTTRGSYDLRCGERRLRAAKAAGLAVVPVIVRELDDKAAMEITVSENMQREDLSPLEESHGVAKLLAVGWELAAIAERLGRAPGWVARRAQISRLGNAWVNELTNPESIYAAWPAVLLELVARLPAATQEQVLSALKASGGGSWRGALPSAPELQRWLAERWLHVLRGAPFALDDATLLPQAGACSACPKRSGAQVLLFEPDEAERKAKRATNADECLDSVCYGRKLDAYAARKLNDLKREHGAALPIVGMASFNEDERAKKRFGRDTVSIYSCKEAKAGQKGAVPAVEVVGDQVGRTRWVIPPAPPRSRPASNGKRNGRSAPQTAEQKAGELARRRQALAIGYLVEAIKVRPGTKLRPMSPVRCLAWLLTVFEDGRAEVYYPTRADQLAKLGERERLAVAQRLVQAEWNNCLVTMIDDEDDRRSFAQAVCRELGLDWNKFEAKAERLLPGPKSAKEAGAR